VTDPTGPSPEVEADAVEGGVVEGGVVEDDAVSVGSAVALHRLLDGAGRPPGAGDPLPPLWHWMAFVPRTTEADLGPDGHPRTGSLVTPPADLPRRMFAGGRLSFPAPARVGAELVRESRVRSSTEKAGRSGRLVFVTVSHVLRQDGRVVVDEEQDLVYRAPATGAPAPTDDPGPPADIGSWTWARDVTPGPTLLFRFSALTYNAHRIHYDRDYATGVEGYPGLVVQGPYQAMALAELCRARRPDRSLVRFEFRGLSPAFAGAGLRLRGRPDGDQVALAAFDEHGRMTMEARAAWTG